MTIATSSPDKRVASRSSNNAAHEKRIFDAIIEVLQHQVLPSVKDDAAITAADLVVRLLAYLREGRTDAPLSLCVGTGLPDSLAQDLQKLSGLPQPEDVRTVAWAENALATVFSKLNAADAHSPEAVFTRELALHERQALDEVDEMTKGGTAETYQGGRAATRAERPAAKTDTKLNRESLERFLRTTKEFGPDASISEFGFIPGGFNKQTIFCTVDTAAAPRKIVIRADPFPNPTGFTVVDEFPILSNVTRMGLLPSPGPIMLVNDNDQFKAPFMIVERMSGILASNELAKDPTAARRFSRELANALASLHAARIDDIVPAPPSELTTRDYVRAEIQRWFDRWTRWKTRPSPAIESAYAWLFANIPQSPRAPSFVHGDAGFHNILVDNGRLTALLDWEFSHLGDPMEDLIYCRPFLEPIGQWQHFLSAYHGAGGDELDERCLKFYGLWPSVRNGSGCNALFRAFLEFPDPDVRFAVAGTTFVRRYELDILERLSRDE